MNRILDVEKLTLGNYKRLLWYTHKKASLIPLRSTNGINSVIKQRRV